MTVSYTFESSRASDIPLLTCLLSIPPTQDLSGSVAFWSIYVKPSEEIVNCMCHISG